MAGRGLLGELRRGMTPLLVLYILASEGDLHGYGLRKRILALTGWEPPESTLYEALKRLEREGLVEAYWARGARTGKLRRVYRTTSAGREELRRLVRALRGLIGPVVCGDPGGAAP